MTTGGHDHTGPERDGPTEPVDTLVPPHEPFVVTPSTIGTWVLTLAGPVVWIVHFGLVYLTAEATCEALRTDDMRFAGEVTLEWIVVIATAVAVLTCAAAGVAAWRRRDDPAREAMMTIGTLLSVGAAASVLAVGLPVLVVGPC